MTVDTSSKLSQELILRAQAYFEKKAGRPVTMEEAEEWLLSLMKFFDILRRWNDEPPPTK